MTEPAVRRFTGVRVIVGMAGLAFAALIVWASFEGDFLQEFAVVMAMPWGQVSLADLYLGFFLYALIVFVVEKNRWAAAFWAVPVFILGNVWAALWFVFRFPTIAARLRG